jgi:hypothetical protein
MLVKAIPGQDPGADDPRFAALLQQRIAVLRGLLTEMTSLEPAPVERAATQIRLPH